VRKGEGAKALFCGHNKICSVESQCGEPVSGASVGGSNIRGIHFGSQNSRRKTGRIGCIRGLRRNLRPRGEKSHGDRGEKIE